MSFDPVSYLLGTKAGGGGNPNYVETITGTLANPWGNVDPAELHSALNANEASCKMTIDSSAIGGNVVTITGDTNGDVIEFGAVAMMSDYAEQWIVYGIEYDGLSSGVLYSAYVLSNGTSVSLTPYASQILTTLTIIHHTLPDTP